MSKKCICDAKECTLCLACMNSCPKDAIFIGTDDNGYEKIQIDSTKCVDCGICEQVCLRRKTVSRHTPVASYAAQAKDRKALERSASGGAFQMLAQIVLERGGVCYGSELVKEENEFRARHTRIDDLHQLPKILNTKYIPSQIGYTLQQVKQDLDTGRFVLFSGTPCQIQGLRSYLTKDYDNLLSADLICHGVASSNLFNQHIKCIEENEGIEIMDYAFRDKTVSWGTNFCYQYYKKADPKQKLHIRHCPREESSYTVHYLRADILRENCYECACANTERFGDFTLGDYWEIEREYPEYIIKGKHRISLKGGVSCILLNTEKAKAFVGDLSKVMDIREVTLDSVTAHNGNLREPSPRGAGRDQILKAFREGGYAAVEDAYRQRVGSKMRLYRIKNILKSCMPDVVRVWIYRSPMLRRIVFHE